ncbi:MAG: hypothetical protein JNN06_16550 [Gemmobacter sp.]|uniref:hypothetical protein n=1 Tax=Gemmobacter sp. TaxID=1898957 RepID=UPI001A6165CD|nr:hypothetical protein [Gemmobacter sp.]MBL8563879.1 hypothetical protein [Gemmobacter sp.]
MSDPFQKFATIAQGGNATPPAPQVEVRPSTMRVEGVTVTSDRITALDRIARQTAAIRAGLADQLADMRAKRDDARQRAGHLRGRISQDPRAGSAAPQLAELDAEIAMIASRISETESELGEAASAAAIARSNLKAGLSFARDHGLAIPAGVDGGRA